MKTKIPGDFSLSPLLWLLCFVLFLTTSGCASSHRSHTSAKSIDTQNMVVFVPLKQGERDVYVPVPEGDNVLIYTKDNRTLDVVVKEIDSEKKTIRGASFHTRDNSWGPSSVYDSSVDVNFSEIARIEIKHPLNPNVVSDIDKDSTITKLPTFGEAMKMSLYYILCPIGCGLN